MLAASHSEGNWGDLKSDLQSSPRWSGLERSHLRNGESELNLNWWGNLELGIDVRKQTGRAGGSGRRGEGRAVVCTAPKWGSPRPERRGSECERLVFEEVTRP